MLSSRIYSYINNWEECLNEKGCRWNGKESCGVT